jgi:hypothetical protein
MQKNYRQCISCRRIAIRSEFWRIVRRHSDQVVVFDQGMGRSAYLCPNAACLQLAQKKDRLSRALKAKVDPTLYQLLQQHLIAENRSTTSITTTTSWR